MLVADIVKNPAPKRTLNVEVVTADIAKDSPLNEEENSIILLESEDSLGRKMPYKIES